MDEQLKSLVDRIDRHWIEPEGFIWRDRYEQVVDEVAFDDLKEILKKVGSYIQSESMVDIRIVKAIWFIPTMLQWNSESADCENFRNKCKKSADDVADLILTQVFGT